MNAFLYKHNLTTNSPCSLHWWSINWDEKVKIKLVHIFYKFFVSFFEWIHFLNVLMSSTQRTVKYSESLGEGSKYCNMCTHKYKQLNFITIYCLNQHYITRVMKMFWCLKWFNVMIYNSAENLRNLQFIDLIDLNQLLFA